MREKANGYYREKKNLLPSFPEQAQVPRVGQLLTQHEQPNVRFNCESSTPAFCCPIRVNVSHSFDKATTETNSQKANPASGLRWPKAVTQLW